MFRLRPKIEVHGQNLAVSATYEPVWKMSTAYTFPTSASNLVVVSTDAKDTLTGVGVRKILIEGLDVNYKVITETVEMDGTTKVNTTKEFLRVNFVKALEVGSDANAAGDITLKDSTETYTLAAVIAGDNQSLAAIYTVPAGVNLRITDIYASEDQNKASAIALFYYENGSNKPKLKSFESLYFIQGQVSYHSNNGFLFTEKTDLYIAALSAGGSGHISAGFIGILV